MIVANEYIFTQAMLDEGISTETIKSLRRKFRGWRIYFRGKGSEYDDIKSDYAQMLEAGYNTQDAINELSNFYEKSRERIKDIISRQGDLFDEI